MGNISKGNTVLTSKGIAPISDSVFNTVFNKYPPASPTPLLPPVLPTRRHPNLKSFLDSITPSVVANVIAEWPRGSAGSRAGSSVSPDFLRHLFESSPRFAQVCFKFIRMALLGDLPLSFRSFMVDKTGKAFYKNVAEGTIRPIAIAESLSRLPGKLFSVLSRSSQAAYLSPIQVGIGVPAAAESINHLVHSVRFNPATQHFALLKTDAVNAFNAVDRHRGLNEIKQHLPELHPFLHWSYSSPTTVYFGGKSVTSWTGFDQGDPLGPTGHAYAVQPLYSEASRRFPSVIVKVYHDDLFALGNLSDLNSFYAHLRSEAPKYGVTYGDSSKNCVWMLNECPLPLPPSF